MLAKSLSALAVIALVAQVSASEPMPYKAQPKFTKMSVRDLFGVQRRQTDTTYQPAQSECGDGATCAEACGAGYDTCTSADNAVHCYNPAAAETCCSDNSGNSCEAGYYCAGDSQSETWCCPNGTDLATCAKQFSVSGVLTSETPRATTTSVSSTSSSSAAPNTTTTTSTTSHHTTHNTTKTAVVKNSTTSCTSTISSSATFAVANSTMPVAVTPTTTTAPSKVPTSAASLLAPAGALAIFVASGFAALF